MITRTSLLAAVVFCSCAAVASPHSDGCTSHTGSYATAIIPTPAVVGVEVGDVIVALTSDGACAGISTWNGRNIALAVWEDDPETPQKEGFSEGESLTFRVWRRGQRATENALLTEYNSRYSNDGRFRSEGVFLVSSLVASTTGAEDGAPPDAFALDQNFPNPLATTTTIRYGLPEQAHDLPQQIPVRIELYNVLGQRVAVLLDEEQPAGWHRLTLDGSSLPSGTYLYRLRAGSFVETRRMLVVR